MYLKIENETKISYTFNDVANDSLRMAQVLTNDGLKDGQNFGICGHNNYEFITTLFGGLIVGGVAVPLNGNTSIGKYFSETLIQKLNELKKISKFQKRFQN